MGEEENVVVEEEFDFSKPNSNDPKPEMPKVVGDESKSIHQEEVGTDGKSIGGTEGLPPAGIERFRAKFRHLERPGDEIIVPVNGMLFRIQDGAEVEVPACVVEACNDTVYQDWDEKVRVFVLKKRIEAVVVEADKERYKAFMEADRIAAIKSSEEENAKSKASSALDMLVDALKK